MISGKSIARGALVVMAATLLSRLFGLVREMEIAEYFGLKGVTDAYLVAFSIPSAVGLAVAAAVSAGFIPVLNSYLVNEDREDAAKIANTLFNSIFAVLLAAAGLGMLFAPLLAARLAPGFSPELVSLTAGLIRIMFPGLVFVGLTGLAAGYLNSHRHFLTPALGPMVTSLVIIGSITTLGPSLGIKGLAIGTLAGFACQLLVQLPVMFKKGFRYRFDISIFHPGVVKVFKLMLPVLIASMVPPVMLLIERGLASELTVGSIAALNYAFRLMQLPQGLFVMAVSVPLFPALSSLAARRDTARLKEIMLKGISVLALIMIPASAGLIALDEPIVRLLFQRGAFEAKDTVPTAYALAFYALALLPLAARDIFRRTFFAQQDTFTPVVLTICGFLLNIILDLALVRVLGLGGLALGASLSIAAEAAVLYLMLNRKLNELPGKYLVTLFLKLTAASAVMGAAAYYVSILTGSAVDLATVQGRMLQVGVSVISGLAVYLAAVVLLRVREVWDVIGMAAGYYRKAVKGTR